MKKIYKFNELKKMANGYRPDDLVTQKLAVIGDCATQHLVTAMNGLASANNICVDAIDTAYNQIELQIANPSSSIYEKNIQHILIVMCTEKLYEDFCSLPFEEKSIFAKSKLDTIRNYWSSIAEKGTYNIMQTNFAYMSDGVFGTLGNKNANSFLFQLRKLNYLLCEAAAEFKNVNIIDVDGIKNTLGEERFHNTKMYYYAKLAFSLEAICHISARALDFIGALNGKMIKCVVLDLDNTLWGGVIGDDGLNGIELGEVGNGPIFVAFQKWLLQLKSRGIILAVCSKNNDDVAREVFLKHPDMVLGLDDISMFVANWDDKATNIKRIQETLNIGMDSILFIDDNPFERDSVKSFHPQINVPNLPDDPALYLAYLVSLNLFDTFSVSDEDQNRTDLYLAQSKRVEYQKQFNNYGEYLRSLEMSADIEEFSDFYVSRISQLTQRSNQFNLRTVRYSEDEITQIKGDNNYITRYFALKDKFGDHGLVSVLILKKQGDALFIDTWLMSCRVLNRSVEELCINEINRIAKSLEVGVVIGEYLPTSKNGMVKDIYGKLGFSKAVDGTFVMDVENFYDRTTYVERAGN